MESRQQHPCQCQFVRRLQGIALLTGVADTTFPTDIPCLLLATPRCNLEVECIGTGLPACVLRSWHARPSLQGSHRTLRYLLGGVSPGQSGVGRDVDVALLGLGCVVDGERVWLGHAVGGQVGLPVVPHRIADLLLLGKMQLGLLWDTFSSYWPSVLLRYEAEIEIADVQDSAQEPP